MSSAASIVRVLPRVSLVSVDYGVWVQLYVLQAHTLRYCFHPYGMQLATNLCLKAKQYFARDKNENKNEKEAQTVRIISGILLSSPAAHDESVSATFMSLSPCERGHVLSAEQHPETLRRGV